MTQFFVKKIKFVAAAVAVLLSGFTINVPIQAKTGDPLLSVSNDEVKDNIERSKKFFVAAKKMEKFITINDDGTLSLNNRSAKEIDIDDFHFNALKGGLEDTNQKIKNGEFRLTGQGLQLEPTAKITKKKVNTLENRKGIEQTASQTLDCQSPWGYGWMIANANNGSQACAYQVWFGPAVEMNNNAVGDFTSGGWLSILGPISGNPLGQAIGAAIGTVTGLVWAVNAAGGYQGVFIVYVSTALQLAVFPR